MSEDVNAIQEHRARMLDFFPPSDSDSPWLLRLAILRDDLQFELHGLPIDHDDDAQRAWKTVYFLRRISITLTEIRAILAREVSCLVKRPSDDVLKGLAPAVRKAIEKLDGFLPFLQNLRNALGGHVRPSNAGNVGEIVEAKVLGHHPNLEGTVRILGDVDKTSYRELTINSILFAWPDADDDAKIAQQHEELHEAVTHCGPSVLGVIDALLVRHWWKLGVVEPPEGFDFAVRQEQGGFRPVQKPTS